MFNTIEKAKELLKHFLESGITDDTFYQLSTFELSAICEELINQNKYAEELVSHIERNDNYIRLLEKENLELRRKVNE